MLVLGRVYPKDLSFISSNLDWGILIAVVAHLPPWRMAAAWADNGEALLCWRGWTDIPIEFTRSNTREQCTPEN